MHDTAVPNLTKESQSLKRATKNGFHYKKQQKDYMGEKIFISNTITSFEVEMKGKSKCDMRGGEVSTFPHFTRNQHNVRCKYTIFSTALDLGIFLVL